MDLPGSSYFLALATISVTFVAFSTIVVAFRQSQGAAMMEYDVIILRLFLVSGLEVTIFSLLPPLLGLFSMASVWVWRISSLIFALVLIWRGIYFLRRQSRFERRHMIDFLYAIYVLGILVLIVNALGIFLQPNAGLYALSVTWLLVNGIITFVYALDRFVHPPQEG